MKLESMIKAQMNTIGDLQEEIKVLHFEVMQLKKEKAVLKEKLKVREANSKKALLKLAFMRDRNNFTDINSALTLLRGSRNNIDE